MFAIWLTGLPASGKSTLAHALRQALAARGVRIAVLESDELRRILTPDASYSEGERDRFYEALAALARTLAGQGVPVLIDATGNQRRYRERARSIIPEFLEILVDCPLEVCQRRDPKGLYRKAREGETSTLPGAGAGYEPPLAPELVVRGDSEDPSGEAERILKLVEARGYLGPRASPA